MLSVASESSSSVHTELLVHGSFVEFVVYTGEPTLQDGLLKIGWERLGDEQFTRRMAATADASRVFNNFTLHIVEMLEQVAGLRAVKWEAALSEFVDRAAESRLAWWLYGSAALAVRGIPVTPKDIDLVVDDAILAGQLLEDLLVEPVRRLPGWIADWGGRAFADAIIEWLSDAHPTGLEPPHEQEPLAKQHLEQVTWRSRIVQVPALELSLQVAKQRGLTQRVEAIQAFQLANRDLR